MRAQMLLGMLFMMAVAVAMVLFVATAFAGVHGAYSGYEAQGKCCANLSNALARDAKPYSEFHIIITNS